MVRSAATFFVKKSIRVGGYATVGPSISCMVLIAYITNEIMRAHTAFKSYDTSGASGTVTVAYKGKAALP
jgi:hypothetical protein